MNSCIRIHCQIQRMPSTRHLVLRKIQSRWFDPLDSMLRFACYSDDEDVTCPYCQPHLTVTSEEARFGEESFQCDQCQGVFTINWDEGKIYYDN